MQEQANFDSRLRKKGDLVALSKVGVVDIGSNSVRLVVFDGAARSPAYYYNEKIMCALGAGLSETGCLNPEGRTRAVAAILRFTYLAKAMGIPRLIAVATAAVRDAQDGAAFVQELKEKTGQAVLVIKGEEEARLSAQGVLLGWPGAYGLICDLGGSSMELAEIGDGKVGKRISARIGPLKLRELQGSAAARQQLIARSMAKLTAKMGPQHNRLFLVGGSWRALARIDMERRAYPLHVIHEYRMDKDAVQKTAAFLRQSDPETLRIKCGISGARMALLPYAIEVLDALVESFAPIDIALSSYGIREGLLYEQMSKKLRKKDPVAADKKRQREEAKAESKKKPRTSGTVGIIIVPNAPTALLTLVNAADLLERNTFVTPAQKRQQGAKKEPVIKVSRTRGDGVVQSFKLVDDPRRLSDSDWKKVVAVVAQGAAWQFKGWKVSQPVDLFNKYLGVHFKYDDSETPKDVKKWNVSVVSVNKHKRHLDPTAAHSFWRLVDDHIARRKKEKAGAAPARRKK